MLNLVVGFDNIVLETMLFCIGEREIRMGKIRLNPDAQIVKYVKEGLKAKNGYCPCRLEKKEEYKCMCEEFKAQIADPDFEGYCHCMLYYKEK